MSFELVTPFGGIRTGGGDKKCNDNGGFERGFRAGIQAAQNQQFGGGGNGSQINQVNMQSQTNVLM